MFVLEMIFEASEVIRLLTLLAQSLSALGAILRAYQEIALELDNINL